MILSKAVTHASKGFHNLFYFSTDSTHLFFQLFLFFSISLYYAENDGQTKEFPHFRMRLIVLILITIFFVVVLILRSHKSQITSCQMTTQTTAKTEAEAVAFELHMSAIRCH